MVFFEFRYLECYLPVSNNIVIFFFLVGILQHFIEEDRNKVQFFSLFVS